MGELDPHWFCYSISERTERVLCQFWVSPILVKVSKPCLNFDFGVREKYWCKVDLCLLVRLLKFAGTSILNYIKIISNTIFGIPNKSNKPVLNQTIDRIK